MKLISMTDFLLHLRGMTTSEICRAYPRRFREPVWRGSKDEMVKDMLTLDAIKWDIVGEYAKFMKKKLELWMFIPCKENGDVFEEPKESNYQNIRSTPGYRLFKHHQKKYQEAQKRVLFKTDIDLSTAKFHISQNRTIEYFTAFDIELTESAIKQIGL